MYRRIKSLNRYLLIFTALLLLSTLHSCIETYTADTDEEPTLISIEGSLINGEEVQNVVVSKTTSLNNPNLFPLYGCSVTAFDDLGNEFVYKELIDGSYRLNTSDVDLVVGRQYMLQVVTPDGEVYESEYVELTEAVPIDSFYYEIEDSMEDGVECKGLQFYIDLKADEGNTRYFRWKLVETYEYSSKYPISFYFLNREFEKHYLDDKYAVYTCYNTGEIDGVYVSSTANLIENEKKKIMLNYVSNLTERLRIKYSIHLRQYTLTEEAYNYFEQIRIMTEEGDGLYTSQPSQPITNFCNVNDSDERVLGIFWVSSKDSKRYFVYPVDELGVTADYCSFAPFVTNLEDFQDGPYPMYIYDDNGTWLTGSQACFDCSRRGGTLTKPSFWD